MSSDRKIALLMAVDEAYAAPLAVCVDSLLDHLPKDVGVDLFLIGPGLAPSTRIRLAQWWHGRVTLQEFLVAPDRLAALLELVGAAAVPAHLRALLGSTLPDEVTKVIYLDADILVQRDVQELWQEDLHGQILLAVQDTYIQELPAFCQRDGEAGFGGQPYFNSGVMVIDVRAWRLAGIEAAYEQAVRRIGPRSRWGDQDALNACLVGRWGKLPPVWNRQFALDLYPDWQCTPHSEEEFRQARSGPAIVHFCSRTKPWHPICDHPGAEVGDFRSRLQRVPLESGPAAPPTLFDRVLERLASPHRHLLDAIAAAARSRQRRHALGVMLPGIVALALFRPWTMITVPIALIQDRASRWFALKRRLRSKRIERRPL